MIRQGTIKLIHQEHAINQLKYHGAASRYKIINMWRDMYGVKFEDCFIQISPDIIEKKVKVELVEINKIQEMI